jgi:4-amino-4-deoxy-L-arabinose transferase-like glycosyltransferase
VHGPSWPATEAHWRRLFWRVWCGAILIRLILAIRLAPFGDEAWYWLESRHLALGYSDLPPATAWLIRLGETLFGHGVLALRAPFLLLGALLPLLIMRTATRVFDARAGWCAGLLVLLMPLPGLLGIFALPDGPLTFAAAWALDAFERAARAGKWRDWTGLGLALALACLSHYRAGMLLVAGFVFLTAFARGRALWRKRGLWLALLLGIGGAVPALLFNVWHDWSALDFQLVERNPWRFHADALWQPIEQALVCTPLFYALLLWALWQTARRRAHAPWDLFLCCAAVPIVGYFVLGLFADATRFRVHWPLPGYLPLLIVLPVLLRTARIARGLRIAAFALLLLGNALAMAYLGMASIPGAASVLARAKAFPQQFVGWHEAAAQTQSLLAQPRFADSILVADNFMLAAELEFALDDARTVYTLDHPINAKHGRAPQLAQWQRDESGLRAHAGHKVLLVVEPGARRARERAAWLETVCSRIADLQAVARLDAYDGRKRYRWYAGVVPAQASIRADTDCVAAQP